MKKNGASVVFIQGFGRRDLFTGVPPESLSGWRRNIGLLIAILNRRGITWQDQFAKHLSDVVFDRIKDVDLFILRDWHYSQEEIDQFRRRYPTTPVISIVFQGPRYNVTAQQTGEKWALFDITSSGVDETLKRTEEGLFRTDHVVVRSELNADLFADLGYSRQKMGLLPHAPMWTLQDNDIAPLTFPSADSPLIKQQKSSFDLLFIGEKFFKKGLFRLYRAFSSLNMPGKRLHIYNGALYKFAKGGTVDLPEYILPQVKQIVKDPLVHIPPPYQGVQGLVEIHNNIDLLVCPSLLDCGPNVVVEAYQLGTPVLASTMCGSIADLPQDAVHLVDAPQWWHHQEEADAFTERIREAITYFKDQQHPNVPPDRPDVSPILEIIIKFWENLLDTYL